MKSGEYLSVISSQADIAGVAGHIRDELAQDKFPTRGLKRSVAGFLKATFTRPQVSAAAFVSRKEDYAPWMKILEVHLLWSSLIDLYKDQEALNGATENDFAQSIESYHPGADVFLSIADRRAYPSVKTFTAELVSLSQFVTHSRLIACVEFKR